MGNFKFRLTNKGSVCFTALYYNAEQQIYMKMLFLKRYKNVEAHPMVPVVTPHAVNPVHLNSMIICFTMFTIILNNLVGFT